MQWFFGLKTILVLTLEQGLNSQRKYHGGQRSWTFTETANCFIGEACFVLADSANCGAQSEEKFNGCSKADWLDYSYFFEKRASQNKNLKKAPLEK